MVAVDLAVSRSKNRSFSEQNDWDDNNDDGDKHLQVDGQVQVRAVVVVAAAVVVEPDYPTGSCACCSAGSVPSTFISVARIIIGIDSIFFHSSLALSGVPVLMRTRLVVCCLSP